ncbi:hypothetical protein HDU77_001789 [Chytriomyces hyalinus]|nr:hypothetical protein HDU77_001789 [Chytriomyces hyalinus]
MRGLATVLALLFLASATNALYFILEGVEQKCFIEELPKDTTVLGKYSAEEWNTEQAKYVANPQQVILISVESVHLRHRVLNQKGAPKGKFTFTSTDFGEHLICVTANGGAQGWFAHSRTKVEFDLIFGDVAHADTGSSTKGAVDDLAVRVRSLKYVVSNILNEQKYQRDREAEFRDFSESINGKVVRWTLLQIFVLLLVDHLKVSNVLEVDGGKGERQKLFSAPLSRGFSAGVAARAGQYTLPPLPYANDALAPLISKETVDFHYGKHHASYVTKLNSIVGDDLKALSIEQITAKGPAAVPGGVYNSAAQTYNHTFYWKSLAPVAGRQDAPSAKLNDLIAKSFGSFDAFKTKFSDVAAGHFGSGWAWLVQNKTTGLLEIKDTHDAVSVIHDSNLTPVLVCDVWEHAYYIDHRNARPNYIATWWKLVNWKFAESNVTFK